jgi:hypothetical protein
MAVACTTVTYPGARRAPESIVMLAASKDTRINFIDGKPVFRSRQLCGEEGERGARIAAEVSVLSSAGAIFRSE